jgi:ABC-2 type transport system permease protein
MHPLLSPHAAQEGLKVTFGRVLRSEWIKFWSLRSTYWVFATFVAFLGGTALVFVFTTDTGPTANVGGGPVPSLAENLGMASTIFTTMVLVVLGVLLVTNEYSSGMIRSTFAAVPTRLPVLLAKAVVAAMATAAVVLLVEAAGFAIGLVFYSANDIDLVFSDGIWRVLAGGAVLAVFYMWFFMGIGALLRNSAGGIVVAYAICFVLPQMLLPLLAGKLEFVADWLPYFPTNAVGLVQIVPSSELGMWGDTAVCATWSVVALALGAWRFHQRDA